MKLYVVEDTYQYDGGSYIHGIFDDPNQALILQQKIRRDIVSSWGKRTSDAGIQSVVNQHCIAVGIREVTLNETL